LSEDQDASDEEMRSESLGGKPKSKEKGNLEFEHSFRQTADRVDSEKTRKTSSPRKRREGTREKARFISTGR